MREGTEVNLPRSDQTSRHLFRCVIFALGQLSTVGPSVSSTKVLSLYLFRASVETNIQRDLFLCIILASSVKTYVLTHISVS